LRPSAREIGSIAPSGQPAADVHLWWMFLDLPYPSDACLLDFLDRDERSRADRFRFEKHRRRFLAAHAARRIILADHLGVPLHDIRYDSAEHGKPSLHGHLKQSVEFNFADSGAWGVLAVSTVPVGIDLEEIRPELPERISSPPFSDRELRDIGASSGDARSDAFFKCWTSKEAYTKGVGLGLTSQWADFDVCALAGRQPWLVRPLPATDDATAWTLCAIDRPPKHWAVLAARGNPNCILKRGWHSAFRGDFRG
jgi:4'-phosphopantetheinyl transferase